MPSPPKDSDEDLFITRMRASAHREELERLEADSRTAANSAQLHSGSARAQAAEAANSANNARSASGAASKHLMDIEKMLERSRDAHDVLSAMRSEISSLKKINQNTTGTATEAVSMLKESRALATSHLEAITATVARAELQVEHLVKQAAVIESSVRQLAEQEARLTKAADMATQQQERIDKLLAGATSVGLASAFDERRKNFRQPIRHWQALFVGTTSLLFALACSELILSGSTKIVPEFSELGRMMLRRLPFIAPLVWLAIYASRQAAMAKRMEEEYAFKATLSTSFEGYRRVLSDVSNTAQTGTPLAKLYDSTLAAIAVNPGRIYEGKRMDPTPITAATDALTRSQAEPVPTAAPNHITAPTASPPAQQV